VEVSEASDRGAVPVSAAGLRVASRCDGLDALLGVVVLAGGLGVWATHSVAARRAMTAEVTGMGGNFRRTPHLNWWRKRDGGASRAAK
jgi:hypothetical protein